VFGSKLKEQVEDRLKFYETGLILFYIGIVSSGEPAVMKLSQLAAVLRIRDVYPGSRILIFSHPGSRILDPRSKNSNKREGWKKIDVKTFFDIDKFHKIVNYFIFGSLEKKI
jgi:hypothetical protein